LRLVNRLIEPTSGRIVLDGEDVTSVDPVQLRRRIGYVIQQVGLFRIRACGRTWPQWRPCWAGTSAAGRARRRAARPGRVGPVDVRRPVPSQLSGGQRQRVGVRRALVADPPVLLMDEPFGAVDPVVRTRLQDEFVALQERLGTTVLFVTHDIDEAVRLGNRVAVFEQGGRLAQYDTPARVLGAPADAFVADFVGADRGLRRLAVTGIDDRDLEQPPVVNDGDSLADARAVLERESARWASCSTLRATCAAGSASTRQPAAAWCASAVTEWTPGCPAPLPSRMRWPRCCSTTPAGWPCWTAPGSVEC
jgi:osmoprotectant transport system ATP-binding protein